MTDPKAPMTKDDLRERLRDPIPGDEDLWPLIVAFVADWLLERDTEPPTATDVLAGMWLREMR